MPSSAALIDLAIAAALIRRHDYYATVRLDGRDLLRDEKSLPVETLPGRSACRAS